MSSEGSVTHWIGGLKAGEHPAAQQVWERYFARLVRLARARLRGVPRAAADEEDVALSAFASFCRCAAQGRFPRLDDRDDLWQVLVLLTARKAIKLRKHAFTQKEGAGKVQHASTLPADSDADEAGALDRVVGPEPTPEFAAQVAEECRRLLDRLGDAELRAVAVGKMEGYTNEELAARLDCAPRTVERRLLKIRSLWDLEGSP